MQSTKEPAILHCQVHAADSVFPTSQNVGGVDYSPHTYCVTNSNRIAAKTRGPALRGPRVTCFTGEGDAPGVSHCCCPG